MCYDAVACYENRETGARNMIALLYSTFMFVLLSAAELSYNGAPCYRHCWLAFYLVYWQPVLRMQ